MSNSPSQDAPLNPRPDRPEDPSGQEQLARVRTIEVMHSARQSLRDFFAGLVEDALFIRQRIGSPKVQDHLTSILVNNVRSGNVEECLGRPENELRADGHRFRVAHQLGVIVHCCDEFEGISFGRGMGLADLYCTLGDQVLFLKGMFNPDGLDKVLDLNATRLPGGVHSVEDMGEFAYRRASELVLDMALNPEDEARAETLELIADHVHDCISGLRAVREEMSALPLQHLQDRLLLTFRE